MNKKPLPNLSDISVDIVLTSHPPTSTNKNTRFPKTSHSPLRSTAATQDRPRESRTDLSPLRRRKALFQEVFYLISKKAGAAQFIDDRYRLLRLPEKMVASMRVGTPVVVRLDYNKQKLLSNQRELANLQYHLLKQSDQMDELEGLATPTL